MDTVLLKVPEVMARLGLGHTKVYDLVASGAPRSVKVGRSQRLAIGGHQWRSDLNAVAFDRRCSASGREVETRSP